MSDTRHDDQERRTIRANNFKYVPCDSINLGVSEGGAKIIFGVVEMDGSVCELVGVHTSIEIAAALKKMLENALKNYEDQTGNKIPDPDVGLGS